MSLSSSRVRTPPKRLALLVENHHETREMYVEWLVWSGFRVIQASSASEAIEKARRQRPDIITTDIGLSGDADGCQLCEALKADERTRKIPVIAVTAWSMGGYVQRARDAGCDSVLIKPCLPQDLLVEIQRLLKLAISTSKTQQIRSG